MTAKKKKVTGVVTGKTSTIGAIGLLKVESCLNFDQESHRFTTETIVIDRLGNKGVKRSIEFGMMTLVGSSANPLAFILEQHLQELLASFTEYAKSATFKEPTN